MPEIRILQPDDQPALEAFLRPRIETSMFLLSNLRRAGLRDRGQPFEGTYAGAFEDEALVGVAGHFWNGVLLPQAPRRLDALWRAAAHASGRAIEGIIGPYDQAEAIRAALGLNEPEHFQLNSTETLYTLSLGELIEPEALRDGRVRARRAGAGDERLLIEWRVAYAIETLGETDGPALRRSTTESVRQLIERDHLWVLEAGGEPVACTAFNAALPEAVQVGGVFTPPERRGRGHARCAVAASLLEARDEGVATAILFTGEENVPAQRAYEALGFRRAGRYRLILLREPVALFQG